ncbi:MAG: RNase adapter RapZ [Gammaproteobacteria bacterium]|nr:RNase adapter RapZ [Gammaproteobacteria bacterium]
MKLVIVSGLSGSGKSVTLHTLEDLDYYCIDNLPVGLLQAFAQQITGAKRHMYEKTAVGIDARNRPDELQRFPEILRDIRQAGLAVEIFFLQAEDDTLLKRFSETRRKHPLTRKGVPLAEAIHMERRLLEPIAEHADMCIDTTRTTVHQLRDLVWNRVQKSPGAISLLFQSFGYKHGVPGDADFVFDIRCLPNPHWDPRLQPLTGLDQDVADYLEQQPLVRQMREELKRFLETWIPRFEAENRSYLTVAIGCTGGQHRSVYLVESLARHFRQKMEHVLTRHRELS